ncbi:MAG: GNAT family N-acetyltransferase [Pseudomonadota bacterium]
MSPKTGEGARPGLLGWCVAEHGRYYAREWGFGTFFEAKVATDMSSFLVRADTPGCHIWWAEDDAGFTGTLTIDGGDADDGLTHLRWFITSDRARGQGLGNSLLNTAISAARDDGARGVFLTTFAGLDAARRLYEKHGFVLVSEQRDTSWGTEVTEQRFEVTF